jgi:hypothetical protein
VTFTATVSAGSGSVAPTGSVQFFDGTTLLGIDSTANSTGIGTSTWSLTTASLTAGTHASIRAVYTATGSFTGSTSAPITQTVNKAAAAINVSGYTGVYSLATGTALGLLSNASTIPIQIGQPYLLDLSTTNGITNSAPYGNNGYRMVNTLYPADQEAQVTLTGAPAAGSGHFVFVFLRTQNPNTANLNAYYIGYQEAGASGTWIVGRYVNHNGLTVAQVSGTRLTAGDTIRASVVGNTVTAYSYHGGVWRTEVSYTMTGGNVVSGPGYLGVEIGGNSPEVKLTNLIGGGYTGAYGAVAHGATGTATGVGGVDLSSFLDLGDSFSNVPGGTAYWTFSGGTNYNDQSGSVAIVITYT